MDPSTIGIVGVVLGAFFLLGMREHKKAEREKIRFKIFTQIPDFTTQTMFVGVLGGCGIAIDAERKLVAIIEGERTIRRYSFNNIQAVSISIKQGTIEKTNIVDEIGGTVAGAIGGGVLLGKRGALIGAALGGSNAAKTHNIIDRFSLKIDTDSLAKPVEEIVFFNKPGCKPNDEAVKKAWQQLEEWKVRLRTVIRNSGYDAPTGFTHTQGSVALGEGEEVGSPQETVVEAAMKRVARSAATVLGRIIVRGIIGSRRR